MLSGQLRQRCRKCKGPGGERLRKLYGCEAPAGHWDPESKTHVGRVVAWLPCWECGDAIQEACEKCHGDVRGVALYRCPRATLPRWASVVSQAYAWFKQGFLPAGGGMMDQTVWYASAMSIIDEELERLREPPEDPPRGSSGTRPGMLGVDDLP